MSSWQLPTRLEVGGKAYPIHSDYRDILDILHRLNDASEPEFIRWRVALALFYEAICRAATIRSHAEAGRFFELRANAAPIPCPAAVGLGQDAPLIAADINKTAGWRSARPALSALVDLYGLVQQHWGRPAGYPAAGAQQGCTTAKKLQPWEQDYYRKNKAMVDLRPRLNPAEIAERQRLQRLLAN